MSFNRLRYDTASYHQNLKENSRMECYQLYGGKFNPQNECRAKFGILAGNDVSLFKGNLVDFESDMMGLGRVNSRCSSNKFQPGNRYGLEHKKECDFISYGETIFAEKPQPTCTYPKKYVRENFTMNTTTNWKPSY